MSLIDVFIIAFGLVVGSFLNVCIHRLPKGKSIVHPRSHCPHCQTPIRWWEKLVPFYDVPFYPGEIEQRFGRYFEIERIAGKIDYSRWPPGYAVYLMTRKGDVC